ncbi:MAG: LacI family DNA-binding transcriptional regulator [Oceanospirillaceae bacterium]|nr:LacI family DNA-binding transcriptional regulator [Oceanospirillaceae bacterium]
MKSTSITIPDVAKAAGVSKSTVSLALQNSPKLRTETKKKVMKAAKQLGYVYNQGAANLRRRSSSMIGMIINDLTNPFFAELAIALERHFSEAGYVVMMANTSEDREQQDKVLRAFCEHGVAGILISPAVGTQQQDFASYFARGLPIVSVMQPIPGAECDYIAPDYRQGIQEATAHLIDQGITRLAFLGGRLETAAYQERKKGFLKAVEDAGIDADNIQIVPCPVTRKAASEAVQQLIEQEHPPQGIVCYCDIVAFGVNFGLRNSAFKVGVDIAVTGFDDVLACDTVSPPLSSMRPFSDQLARLACDSLIQKLKDPSRPVSNHLVKPKLIVRESSILATLK